MVVVAESHRVGRKKGEEPMAATRLTQVAYECAKRAARLQRMSAVAYISRVVLRAAREDIARAIEEARSKDLSGELASLKEKREAELRAEIEDLRSYLEPGEGSSGGGAR